MYCLYYFVLEKIGQSGCRQYFLLQSMHKSSAQLYFLLQSLYPVPSRTTAYYKPLTKYFPMLLRTAKITQNNSQYFVALFISLPAWRASVPEEESSSSWPIYLITWRWAPVWGFRDGNPQFLPNSREDKEWTSLQPILAHCSFATTCMCIKASWLLMRPPKWWRVSPSFETWNLKDISMSHHKSVALILETLHWNMMPHFRIYKCAPTDLICSMQMIRLT